MRPVVAISVGLLSLTSSACFLTAGIRQKHDTCLAEIQQLGAPDRAPPSVRLDGNWQCMYTDNDGDDRVENLTFITNGSSLTMTGRDNFNNNITVDAKQGGKTVTFTGHENGFRIVADPSGRLLDGKFQYWGPSGTCLQARYICRRR